MKKYALMIVASGLFCVLQVQPSEKSLRTFKHEVTREVAFSAEIYGDMGLNDTDVEGVIHFAKGVAIAKKIPLNQASSIVINALAQRAFSDLERLGEQAFRQRVFEKIIETVNDIFGLN